MLVVILLLLFIGVPILLPLIVVKLTTWETDNVTAAPPPDAAPASPAEQPRIEIATISTEEFAKNPFRPPATRIEDIEWGENNSGGGRATVPPKGVKGWSLGPFVFNWIWALANRSWIGLLCLLSYIPLGPLPLVGLLSCVYLAIRGRELAWRNKRWNSLEHFNRVQKRWSIAAYVLVGLAVLAFLAPIVTMRPYPVR